MKNLLKTLKPHPLLAWFPDLYKGTMDELTTDIKANAQCSPILTYKGLIVDGRARLAACKALRIEPKFEEVTGTDEEIVNMMVSLNLKRRHLDDSQRAMIAARFARINVGGNQHSKDAISQGKAAKQLNVSVDSVQRAKKVQANGSASLVKAVDSGELEVAPAAAISVLPAAMQDELVAKGKQEILKVAKELNKGKKEEKRTARLGVIEALRVSSNPLLPDGERFEVIVADPPWQYLPKDRTPYPTMTLREITALPVKSKAADNAALFVWCPASMLQAAFAVIHAWGFDYRTCAVWKKGESGLGPYFRVNHELLLFAVRGKLPSVPDGSKPMSCFEEAKTDHSRKPQKAYEMIEAMYPGLTKLELFCRGDVRQGWSGWGNECVGAIDADVSVQALTLSPAKDLGDQLLESVAANEGMKAAA